MNKKIKMSHESSSLILHIWEDEKLGHSATITDLFSNIRNNGHASALMEKTLSYTDKAGYVVYLEAKRFGHPIGIDNSALQKFYEKFGFVKEEGTTPLRWMHRPPSQELHGI